MLTKKKIFQAIMLLVVISKKKIYRKFSDLYPLNVKKTKKKPKIEILKVSFDPCPQLLIKKFFFQKLSFQMALLSICMSTNGTNFVSI